MEISDDLLRFVLYGRLRSPFERNFHLQGLYTFVYLFVTDSYIKPESVV